jgi:hypothetical protein
MFCFDFVSVLLLDLVVEGIAWEFWVWDMVIYWFMCRDLD